MTTFCNLALGAALFGIALSASAQAQQINVPTRPDAGTSAKIARVQAFGNAYPDAWKTTVNSNCSNVDIGSTVTPPNNMNPGVPGGPLPPATANIPSTINRDPSQVTVVTGTIYNICGR
jgi:hypothetical protein